MPEIPFCHTYCLNRYACCQDWPVPANKQPDGGTVASLPAAPQLCRMAAMWNAQGQTPFMCPVPLDSSGTCPCLAGTARCPPHTVNVPQDLAP